MNLLEKGNSCARSVVGGAWANDSWYDAPVGPVTNPLTGAIVVEVVAGAGPTDEAQYPFVVDGAPLAVMIPEN